MYSISMYSISIFIYIYIYTYPLHCGLLGWLKIAPRCLISCYHLGGGCAGRGGSAPHCRASPHPRLSIVYIGVVSMYMVYDCV
jgi:hypothetical protein